MALHLDNYVYTLHSLHSWRYSDSYDIETAIFSVHRMFNITQKPKNATRIGEDFVRRLSSATGTRISSRAAQIFAVASNHSSAVILLVSL